MHELDARRALGNDVLRRLPEHTQRTVARDLQPQHLQRGAVLALENAPVGSLYFPARGLISLMRPGDQGSVGVAAVGPRSLLGSLLSLGDDVSPWEAIVEVEGEALVMSASSARWHARNDPVFARALHADALALLHQLSLAVACHAFHPIAQRLARWLLTIEDAAKRPEFAITQDALAQLLGVQRSSVTLSAGALRRSGAADFRRGRVTVLDRNALLRQSCRCYESMTDCYARLARAVGQ